MKMPPYRLLNTIAEVGRLLPGDKVVMFQQGPPGYDYVGQIAFMVQIELGTVLLRWPDGKQHRWDFGWFLDNKGNYPKPRCLALFEEIDEWADDFVVGP